MKPEIEILPTIRLVGIQKVFNSETRKLIPAYWDEFVPRISEIQQVVNHATYGASMAVDETEQHGGSFIYMCAMEVELSATIPKGMSELLVPESRYAKFTFDGHISEFPKYIDDVWSNYFPETGLELRNTPSFERYDERWIPETGLGPVDYFMPIIWLSPKAS
jgi:AraC family transcriptional regulator